MDSKLFTIIVPTYNRSILLSRALTALLPTVVAHKDHVNVHISDNASTDDTQNVVNRFISEYPEVITYHCQKENLGAQLNFRDAARRVNSRYIAILSDDDIVTPYYVSTILNTLKQMPDLAYINANMLIARDSGNAIFGVRDKVFNSGLGKRYNTGADFLKEHTMAPSLVSANVFIREDFNLAFDKIEVGMYPGYDWYAAMCFSIADKPAYYIDFPLLIMTVPALQRWSLNAPLYTIRGLGRIFFELDQRHSGLFDAWRISFLDSFQSRTHLQEIAEHKDVYKSRYADMIEFAVTPGYKKLISLYTNYPRWVADFVVKCFL